MKKRILCYGDSNTWGMIPGGVERYDDDTRWTGVMQKELGEEYLVIPEGYNGRTTVFDDPIENRISGVKYFLPCTEIHSPLDLVIIMLGTNDLKPRFSVDPGSISYGLKHYINTLKISPMIGGMPKVLLAAPMLVDPAYKNNAVMDNCFGDRADERSRGFHAAFSEAAKNLQIEYINAADYAKASELDGIHMDADNHHRLGMAFADKVREMLAEE